MLETGASEPTAREFCNFCSSYFFFQSKVWNFIAAKPECNRLCLAKSVISHLFLWQIWPSVESAEGAKGAWWKSFCPPEIVDFLGDYFSKCLLQILIQIQHCKAEILNLGGGTLCSRCCQKQEPAHNRTTTGRSACDIGKTTLLWPNGIESTHWYSIPIW